VKGDLTIAQAMKLATQAVARLQAIYSQLSRSTQHQATKIDPKNLLI
jgi:hypothetical protein